MKRKVKKLDLRDEIVLAAIIAGGAASQRKVLPSLGQDGRPYHFNGYGVCIGQRPEGPVCAVGAGLLYAGISNAEDPLETFSEKQRRLVRVCARRL